MSMHGTRPCPCGSGKDSHWQHDARGIPLCRTCETCHQSRMAGYRPEVLTDPNYECDEEIEPDEPYDRDDYGAGSDGW